jgi:hypothetical protein
VQRGGYSHVKAGNASGDFDAGRPSRNETHGSHSRITALPHDSVYIPGVRFSDHFERGWRDAVDRQEITLEMCERVRAQPLQEEREHQPRGRVAYWGYVAEKSRYLKVVVEADGEEIRRRTGIGVLGVR